MASKKPEKNKTDSENQQLRPVESGNNDVAKSMMNRAMARASGTLLHYAARRGNATIARCLINVGTVVDSHGENGKTPLMLAVEQKNVKCVRTLLKAGADIDFVNPDGESALQMAIQMIRTDYSIAKEFFRRIKAEAATYEEFVERLHEAGCTLHHAVHLSDVKLLKGLLKLGCDIESKNANGYTPLILAANIGEFKAAKALVKNGANVNVLDDKEFTPLSFAAIGKNVDMVEYLLEHGADPNIKSTNFYGYTPLLALFASKDIPCTADELDGCAAIMLQYSTMPQSASAEQLTWVPGSRTILDFATDHEGSKAAEYLIAHLAMLEMIGDWPEASIDRCGEMWEKSKIPKLEEMYKKCQRILKVTVFGSVTLFDLLAGSEDKMRIYVRNEEFRDTIEKFCKEKKLSRLYRYYYLRMMRRISTAERMVKLEDEAIPVICDILKKNHSECYMPARKIVGYLDECDLKKLSKV